MKSYQEWVCHQILCLKVPSWWWFKDINCFWLDILMTNILFKNPHMGSSLFVFSIWLWGLSQSWIHSIIFAVPNGNAPSQFTIQTIKYWYPGILQLSNYEVAKMFFLCKICLQITIQPSTQLYNYIILECSEHTRTNGIKKLKETFLFLISFPIPFQATGNF